MLRLAMGGKQVGLLLAVVMLVLDFECGNCNGQKIGKVVSIKSNAVTRLEDSESVLRRDSRSVDRSRRSVTNSVETMEALDAHNRLRRSVGASDAELMTWNDYLASMADDWARGCQWRHGQPYRDPTTQPYHSLGQNLYGISGTTSLSINVAIQAWYDERPYYNYETLGCQAGEQCGHYTQIVWATSRELGCAYANCPTLYQSNLTSSAKFLVCNYGPAGNVVGQKPFKMGTACSRCASGSWWCNNRLCDRSCSAVGPSCACGPTCENLGFVNRATCSCSCAPGWHGSDCSVVCEDIDPRCNPKPGGMGYPPSYCTHSDYGLYTRENCPKMCKQCQASGNRFSTPTKTLLLSMALAIWLSRYS